MSWWVVWGIGFLLCLFDYCLMSVSKDRNSVRQLLTIIIIAMAGSSLMIYGIMLMPAAKGCVP